ncbi:MAG: hypothetical protein IH959_10055 [Chloroflexi bacterium]|nr:hypothetical protein [Chloroflexota bacterium]
MSLRGGDLLRSRGRWLGGVRIVAPPPTGEAGRRSMRRAPLTSGARAAPPTRAARPAPAATPVRPHRPQRTA